MEKDSVVWVLETRRMRTDVDRQFGVGKYGFCLGMILSSAVGHLYGDVM